jgi:membrane associated rhomboid family serine protease
VLPIFDDNPTRRRPVLTIGLILACLGVFLYQQTLPDDGTLGSSQAFVCEYGVVAVNVVEGPDPRLDPDRVGPGDDLTCEGVNGERPRYLSLITSLFLHADWLHLIGNMLFLWVFGNNVEDRLGRLRYLPFFLTCGVLAGLAQALSDPGSGTPLIGASGAISGVVGAYLVLFPRAGVWTLVMFVLPLKIPAWLWGAIYFALQFLLLREASATGDDVAYWAHIGGFVAGMALVRVFAAGRDAPPPAPGDRALPMPAGWGR